VGRKIASQSDRHGVWRLAPYGVFGALLPSIVAVANRSDGFAFTPDPHIFFAQGIYLAAAAVLSAIFPYGRDATPFRATLVGIAFPTIVGTAASVVKVSFPALVEHSARGDGTSAASIVGRLLDAFALF
jgi:hypothetical protein